MTIAGKRGRVPRMLFLFAFLVSAACGGGGAVAEPPASPQGPGPAGSAPDIGQYFDGSGGAANFPDASRHPLGGLTTPGAALRFSGANCLGCHDGGRGRAGDECLLCHFENQPNAPASNHGDGILQMATVPGDGSLPATGYPIPALGDYDAWCLQCHAVTTVGLGGRFPSVAARTVLDPARVAASRHRARGAGCVHCHAPHGSANTRLVRENPANRMAAGSAPMRFGAFPDDNLSVGGYGAAQSVPYRSRVVPGFADADDENAYCNKACHAAGTDPSWSKERTIKRDGATGLYVLAGTRKIVLVEGVERTVDNATTRMHGHVTNDIISTDDMVTWYAAAIGTTGPSRYRYPGAVGADPAAFDPGLSPLPLFPDFPDGYRDFTNGYSGRGLIRYRYTCSTCHDPHGTPYTTSNGIGGDAYPDLRLKMFIPNGLCAACHR